MSNAGSVASNNYADFVVYFNDIKETRVTNSLTIIQQDAAHTVAMVDVYYSFTNTILNGNAGLPNLTHAVWPSNARVSIVYGFQPFIIAETFYGYVAGHTIIQKKDASKRESGFFKVRYILIGTSQVMQVSKSRSFKNMTASAIASQVSRENGFRPIVTPSTEVFDYYAQDRISDFALLSNLAERIGFRFRAGGTDLYFVNPFLEFKRDGSEVRPSFVMNRNNYFRDTLIDFQPVVGESVPDGGIAAIRRAASLNSNTGMIISATNQYLRYAAFNTDFGPHPIQTIDQKQYIADDYVKALALVNADTLKNRYWASADVTLEGDPRVSPGRLLTLSGTAMYGPYQGAWAVTSATHTITRDINIPQHAEYRITATVGRDQLASVSAVVPPEWDKVYDEVHAVAINGKWRASNYGGLV